MADGLEHIATWQAAGLIDAATADRLRAAEIAPSKPTPAPMSASARIFGPSVSVEEVFGYLGGAFLIASWSAFMASTVAGMADPNVTLAIMGLLAAAVMTGFAMRLRRGGERSSRAAGVVLLVALGFVSGSAYALASGDGYDWQVTSVVVSTTVLLAAVAYRLLHPTVLTQVGLLAALTALAGSLLAWLQQALFPTTVSETTGLASSSGPDPIILVIASAAWWLLVAVGIGLLGLAEARGAGRSSDPTSSSRAAVTRFWAGVLAVVGLWSAVSRSGTSAVGEGRVLEAVVGDMAMLILCAVLVERAFRRDATSYIYAAALGLIVALTDFNVSYLSDSAAAALLVEGLILIGVGIGADRLRRRIRQGGPTAPADPADPADSPDPLPLDPVASAVTAAEAT